MSYKAKITLSSAVIDGVFTPDHYAFGMTAADGTVAVAQNIPLGTDSVESQPFDLADGTYTASAQLIDATGKPQGTAITQTITLPLPATTTTAQVPSTITITAA